MADALIYYSYIDVDAGSKGLSAFVIEPKNFHSVKTTKLDKMGSFCSPTGEVFLDNTKVPKENILGEPIGDFQMNQDIVVQMTTEIDAARLLVYKAAWFKDQGKLNNGLDVPNYQCQMTRKKLIA